MSAPAPPSPPPPACSGPAYPPPAVCVSRPLQPGNNWISFNAVPTDGWGVASVLALENFRGASGNSISAAALQGAMIGYCPSGECQPMDSAVELAARFNPNKQWGAFGQLPELQTIDPRVGYILNLQPASFNSGTLSYWSFPLPEQDPLNLVAGPQMIGHPLQEPRAVDAVLSGRNGEIATPPNTVCLFGHSHLTPPLRHQCSSRASQARASRARSRP